MIKNRLKEIRMKEYMLSQIEFCKILEIPNTTYSNWESGVSRPTLEQSFNISDKLNKKLEDIWYLAN